MWVEPIENPDPVLVEARRLAAGAVDGMFSAAELASALGIAAEDALRRLADLEEADWVARDDFPATVDTRWALRVHATLTRGRRYEVLEMGEDWLRLLDDQDGPVLFHVSGFRVVDASEPAFWEDGAPPEWARPGFFEDYFELEPVVRETFWRVVRENYPDTWNERAAKTQRELAALNPDVAYAPVDFDYPVAMARARALFVAVRRSFPEARLDDQVQDATYHAGIAVGAGEVRLSNFGRLAVLTSEEAFAPEAVVQLVALLRAAGYRYVPFAVFGAPFVARERFNGDLFTQLFDYV